jgi:hypothetical protein
MEPFFQKKNYTLYRNVRHSRSIFATSTVRCGSIYLINIYSSCLQLEQTFDFISFEVSCKFYLKDAILD